MIIIIIKQVFFLQNKSSTEKEVNGNYMKKIHLHLISASKSNIDPTLTVQVCHWFIELVAQSEVFVHLKIEKGEESRLNQKVINK